MTYLGTISNARNGDKIDGYLMDAGPVMLRATIKGITRDSYIELEDWQEMVAIAGYHDAASKYAAHAWRNVDAQNCVAA